jgi:GntP family gluconate:H+ symporter
MVGLMLLSALLLPVAVAAVVLAVQRLGIPVFLAIMAVVIGYGIAADMTWQSIGRAFGLGFVDALERTGLLVMAGSLVGTLLIKRPLTGAGGLAAGVIAGLGGTAPGGLALLQPAGKGAPRQATIIALTLLVAHGLLVPSPLAVASMSVMKADLHALLIVGVPAAIVGVAVAWVLARRLPEGEGGTLSFAWIAVALPLVLLVVQSIAQMPTEPLGKGGAREFYTGISHPLMLAALAIALAMLLSRRWQPAVLADTSWATLLLAVGAAGGFARVLDETGMAELWAEPFANPHLGLLAPFLAAATVKTLQGNSLSAVLTASGMIEPLLPALGLDSATGRALAAAAVGAGSIAICHVNDPFFWIAASMTRLPPGRALVVISLGSLLVAVAALGVLAVLGTIL